MTLPANFVFTQNNLQDFEDCPRRFELRHLLHLAWPAPQTEPILEHEQHMLRGEIFHRLAQQYMIGIPADQLSSLANQQGLSDWWQTFLEDSLVKSIPSNRWPEITLSMPFSNFRLLCKMDLVTVDTEGNFVVFDWKTSPRKTPGEILKNRWQTLLYPFVLQHAASALDGSKPSANQIKMVYWFVEDPSHPHQFHFSEEQSVRVDELLHKRIDEINLLAEGQFFLTSDERRCAFCIYRSLCERGEAGSLDEDPSEYDPPASLADLNFEQIGEISI